MLSLDEVSIVNYYIDAYFLWQVVPFLVLAYYYFFYLGELVKQIKTLDKHTQEKEKQNFPAVSVIIAAKNEEKNLKSNLPYFLNQSYPEYEVLIVNDNSEDQTLAVLEQMKDLKLKVVDLKGRTGKKNAISYGIENARHEYLLFTDADCQPISNQWIKEMMSKFLVGKELVLGYSKFYPEKSILNYFIRYESFMNASQYFAFAARGEPYMGVGRNLAYKRELYEKSQSFLLHNDILSGDDDLIVNEMANKENVSVCMNEQGQTMSRAKQSWRAYITQKRRQLQAGNFYKRKDRIRLAFLGLGHLVFNISSLILLLNYPNKLLILSIFVLKWGIQYNYLYIVNKKVKDFSILSFFWFFEFFYYIIVSLIGVSTWIWKVKKWQ